MEKKIQLYNESPCLLFVGCSNMHWVDQRLFMDSLLYFAEIKNREQSRSVEWLVIQPGIMMINSARQTYIYCSEGPYVDTCINIYRKLWLLKLLLTVETSNFFLLLIFCSLDLNHEQDGWNGSQGLFAS